jgi:hypothetical protein
LEGNAFPSETRSTQMRILHVVPTYLPAVRYSGPIFAVHGLCRALARWGHYIEVFTTNVDGSRRERLAFRTCYRPGACWVEKSNLKHAAALHLTSELEAEELERFGWQLPRRAVIPNGIDELTLRETAFAADVEEAAAEQPLVGFFGRRTLLQLDRNCIELRTNRPHAEFGDRTSRACPDSGG